MSRSSSLTVGWAIITRDCRDLTTAPDLFPLKVSSVLYWRPWETDELLKRFDSTSLSFLDPVSLVKRAIPESAPIKVTEILPRLKEGGAYVKFRYPSNMSAAEIEGMPRVLLLFFLPSFFSSCRHCRSCRPCHPRRHCRPVSFLFCCCPYFSLFFFPSFVSFPSCLLLSPLPTIHLMLTVSQTKSQNLSTRNPSSHGSALSAASRRASSWAAPGWKTSTDSQRAASESSLCPPKTRKPPPNCHRSPCTACSAAMERFPTLPLSLPTPRCCPSLPTSTLSWSGTLSWPGTACTALSSRRKAARTRPGSGCPLNNG